MSAEGRRLFPAPPERESRETDAQERPGAGLRHRRRDRADATLQTQRKRVLELRAGRAHGRIVGEGQRVRGVIGSCRGGRKRSAARFAGSSSDVLKRRKRHVEGAAVTTYALDAEVIELRGRVVTQVEDGKRGTGRTDSAQRGAVRIGSTRE